VHRQTQKIVKVRSVEFKKLLEKTRSYLKTQWLNIADEVEIAGTGGRDEEERERRWLLRAQEAWGAEVRGRGVGLGRRR
jgi:hypothetical protein